MYALKTEDKGKGYLPRPTDAKSRFTYLFSQKEREKYDQGSIMWHKVAAFPDKLKQQSESGHCVVMVVYKPERWKERLKQREPRLYSIQDSSDFEAHDGMANEYISTRPVSADKIQEHAVAGYQDVMRAGVQIYYIDPEHLPQAGRECYQLLKQGYKKMLDTTQEKILGSRRPGDMRDLDFFALMAFLEQMEKEGKLVHANKLESICPIDYKSGIIQPVQPEEALPTDSNKWRLKQHAKSENATSRHP